MLLLQMLLTVGLSDCCRCYLLSMLQVIAVNAAGSSSVTTTTVAAAFATRVSVDAALQTTAPAAACRLLGGGQVAGGVGVFSVQLAAQLSAAP